VPPASIAPSAPPSAAGYLLPGDRDAESLEFETAVVSYFLDASNLLGVPKSLALIYGSCFASPDALSPADLKQRLDLSVGSISQGIRFLTGLGALQDVSAPGDRVARYAPDIELRKLLIHFLERRVEAQLDSAKDSIRRIRDGVPRGASRRMLQQRVASLESWHGKTRALLPLLKGALRLG